MSGACADQLIANRYRMGRLLGRGGMGEVYFARDLTQLRDVAVKVILPDEPHERLLSRILRESRLASRLQHPHVVSVLDYGRWGESRERFFLVMELVRGLPLSALVNEVSLSHACTLIGQLLTALAHVHARGVLHRDIKPDNILVVRHAATGHLHALLADFGIAAAIDESGHDRTLTRLTVEGSLLGTPAYMAPEQAEGSSHLGPPCDLYALGAVLYELLSGRVPFSGTLAQILVKKCTEEAPLLQHRPEAAPHPPFLTALLRKLLARTPNARYALAADALADLEPWIHHEPFDEARWHQLYLDSDPTSLSVSAQPTLDSPNVTPPAFPSPESSPLWGREESIATLEECARRAEAGLGQVVMIFGEIGIGKSSVAENLATTLNELGRFDVLRAHAFAESGAQSAIALVLDSWLGTRNQSVNVLEASLRALLPDHEELAIADILAMMRPAEAASSPPPDIRRASATLAATLRALAKRRPVLLLLDALPPDAETAVLLEVLLFELDIEPFPGLCLFPMLPAPSGGALRTTLARASRAEGRTLHLLELGPLPLDVMVSQLELQYGLPPHVAEAIAVRSSGNPLFLHHLTRSFATPDPTSHTLSLSGIEDALPTSLRELLLSELRARLAALPNPSRVEAMLDLIAVLGERVEVQLIEELTTEPEARLWLDDDLDMLISAGLLKDDGHDAVSFAQGLARSAIVESLPPRRARRLHQRAAHIRSERASLHPSSVSPEEHAAIAEHQAASGDKLRAADSWIEAHTRATRVGRRHLATRCGRRAIELLPDSDPRRDPLALSIGRLLRANADWISARALTEPLLNHPNADLALRATEILSEVFQEIGEIQQWHDILENARARLPEASTVGRAALLRSQAFHHNNTQNFTAARDCGLLAIDLSEDDLVGALNASTRVVFACLALGDITAAQSIAQRILERVSGDNILLSRPCLRLMAMVDGYLGNEENALALSKEVLQLQRKSGDTALLVSAMVDIAGLAWACGQHERARHLLSQAQPLAERFDMLIEQLRCKTILILDALGHQRIEDATRLFETIETSRMLERYGTLPIPVLLRSLVLLSTERLPEARLHLARLRPEALPSAHIFTIGLDMLVERLIACGELDFARTYNTFALRRWTHARKTERIAHCQERAALLSNPP